jgi:3-oxoacyl-[acyl-carrier protein] reductase
VASGGGTGSIVVTGPSRGIGRATVLLAARRGLSCYLLGRPSAALTETLALCNAENPALRHHVVPCDLASFASIEAAAAMILAETTPRALINNAGIIERAPLEVMGLDSLRRQLDVNLLGPIWLTRLLLPAMRRAGTGRIVNVGSISGTLGTPEQTAYNASKWGLLGFTKSLAEELVDSGLMTVAILPGAVATDMLLAGHYPARMTAEDVALTLLHYALDAPLAHNGGSVEMFGI